jgi:hypothetical protein
MPGYLPACLQGAIHGVSTNARELLAAADIILISVTAPAIEGLIRELAPHLRSNQLLFFLQGTGAVNFMMLKSALQDCVKSGMKSGANSLAGRMPMYAAAKVLPWACRVQAPAQVSICGTKDCVSVALAPGANALLRVMVPQLLGGLFPGTRFLLDAEAALEQTYFPFGALCASVIVSFEQLPVCVTCSEPDWLGSVALRSLHAHIYECIGKVCFCVLAAPYSHFIRCNGNCV